MSPVSTFTVYIAELSVTLLEFVELSIATTVTLYVPGVLAAVIVPSHMSFPASVSGTSLAVTLAILELSVTLTVTVIGSFGSTSVRLSATE